MVSLVQAKVLAFHDAFDKGSFVFRGVPRTEAHQVLVGMVEERGIKIHWGHKLISFKESESSVEAMFENGQKYIGSFVIGCDGLNSGSRNALFGQERPDYLGMTQVCSIFTISDQSFRTLQTGGWSPVPEEFKGRGHRFYQFFAEGAHMVCYYCKEDTVSWA